MLCLCALGCDRTPRELSFQDRATDSGVRFYHVCGGKEKDYILEVNGGGVALFDYDGDGDLDIFLVNGSTFDAPSGPGAPSDALFRNDGGLRFTDVTDEAGLREDAWGCGATVADIDNDGDLDLYVTNYGPDALWINQGGGSFAPGSLASGPFDPGWGSSATFLDYDRDGLVDLFVVNYLEFDRAKAIPRGDSSCQYKGQQILCGPVGFPQGRPTLYHNLGEGRFEDVSRSAGLLDAKPGYGLGVIVCDIEMDGWPDIYLTADTTDNLLFHNLKDGRFEEVGLAAGVARNDMGMAQAGMGVDAGFVRGPDLEDIFVVNYEDDNNTYYRNDGGGFFTEVTTAAGLAAPCFKNLGWSAFFADFDLDGKLDIFVAQGHVVPQVDAVPSSPGYRQKNKLFLGDGTGRFRDVSDSAGPGLQVKKSSRGAACGDLDGDGDLDIVVNDIDDEATLLECTGKPLGRWVALDLVGTRSNRAAIGAVVRLRAGGTVQARRVKGASSYASHCELAVRFGLGSVSTIEELEVTWPSGLVETFPPPAVDQRHRLEEGKGTKKA